ncbi:uncharacterized protein cenpu [Brachyhypopomus gauderio]|uniref:uncharacterized protein cenpu n=1 Tax=Brachyhypopomus gauderio TaxID=698409 RepID=UPI004042B3D2
MSKCLQGEDTPQPPDSLDVSSIEKASFLQGDQYSSHGNPLHSTALEDEPSAPTDGRPRAERHAGDRRAARGGPASPTGPARSKKGPATTRRSRADPQRPKRGREAPQHPTRHLQAISESRQENRRKSRPSEVSGAAVSEDPTTDGSAGVASRDARQRSSLSSEELTDEDESFDPDNEKHKASRVRRPRSSSRSQSRGPKRRSSAGSADRGNLGKKLKRGAVRNPIDLEVILEAFQHFVSEYKETVHSEPVKQAIDTVSRSFEEQLDEMITAAKEAGSVKRTAGKINSTLNRKKSRLVEVKSELIKTEAELGRLQREHCRLEQRLAALARGTTFLANLKELNERYQRHRTAHPEEPQTYGPSCLPAMMLEARSIMGTENQLKMINDQMQQFLEETGHK